MKNKILTGMQIFLILVWAIASYMSGDSINLFVFNILPIPNFGLVLLTIILVIVGYLLQGMKDKK